MLRSIHQQNSSRYFEIQNQNTAHHFESQTQMLCETFLQALNKK